MLMRLVRLTQFTYAGTVARTVSGKKVLAGAIQVRLV